MKISFNTRLRDKDTVSATNGYGYATKCILEALESLGYEVTQNDPTADVGFVFDQPPYSQWFGNQYRVHLHPWESTKLLPGWDKDLNQADEVWSPNDLMAEWYPGAGVKKPVFVYEHGIEHEWEPRVRTGDGPVRFLILGMEATRKNGWQALNYIRDAFNGTGVDYQVTAKMVNSSWNGFEQIGRVKYINKTYSFDELQELFYSHDYLVHMSSGEGFGFPPLQALASGMPAIMIPEWAPYRRFTDPRLHIKSQMVTTPWPDLHPGKVFRPEKDSVIECLRRAVDDYDSLQRDAFKLAPQIHEEYDWKKVTEPVFKNLENRLGKLV